MPPLSELLQRRQPLRKPRPSELLQRRQPLSGPPPGKLLQKELVDVIASDAHDVRIRTPELELCARQIEKKYGRSLAQRLLCDSPKAILMGSKE